MVQLVYSSAEAQPFTPDALKTLLLKARLRNTTYSVSGMLLYHGGSFLQVLEGDSANVDMIYRSISRDARHIKPRVLHTQDIMRREFPDWSMGYIDTSSWPLRSPGQVDYQQVATTSPTAAHRYLRLFQQGLCRQALAA